MKRRDRRFDIFSLSFLDVISCGFGAVVMLILISKPDVELSTSASDDVSALLNSLVTLQNSITQIKQSIGQELDELEQVSNQKQSIADQVKSYQDKLKSLDQSQSAVADNIAGLSLVEERLKQASLSTPRERPASQRDAEVGGIPVDSDYVVFVIDTSGSMKNIWGQVSREVVNVLNIHPQVKGFQILNDMGQPMISGYDGQWMPDTPSRRKSVIDLFGRWNAVSNSSPVEGLTVALRKYAKPNISTSIYVFGDDFTGSSYDSVVETVTQQNKTLSGGQRLAKIHSIGFISPGTTNRFSILMRELSKRNAGTFIALPR